MCVCGRGAGVVLTSRLTCPGHAICLSKSVYWLGPTHKHVYIRKFINTVCIYRTVKGEKFGFLPGEQVRHQHSIFLLVKFDV